MATPNLNEKVLEHVQVTHAALDQANKDLTKVAEEKKAAAAMIPQVVDELIKHARIDPKQRDEAIQLLADPIGALKVLLKTADPGVSVRPAPLGAPQDGETPRTKKGHYLGQRTAEEGEAERAFRERLLG